MLYYGYKVDHRSSSTGIERTQARTSYSWHTFPLAILVHYKFRAKLFIMVDRKKLWQYSHSASIFCAVLLFTAGFLCVLLWTNNLVHTPTSVGDPSISTFTQFSPAVSTFDITYNVVCRPTFRFQQSDH
jgi:hypothetical protein